MPRPHKPLGLTTLLLLTVFGLGTGDGVSFGQDWVQWRGARGDGHAESARLDPQTLASGPKILWKRSLGRGFSGISIFGSMLFTADVLEGKESLVAISRETGEDLWRSEIGAPILEGIPGEGPRATPAVDERAVYVVGSLGDVVAADRLTGRELWRFPISEWTDWRPAYGFSASPILWENLVLYPAGGKNGRAVIALDRETGALRWSSADGPSSYSTPTLGTVAGVLQLVVLTNQGVWGLAPRDGQVLWHLAWPEEPFESSASPVLLSEDRIFVSAQGMGSALLEIERNGEKLHPEIVWSTSGFSNDYATPVALGERIYGASGSFLLGLSLDDGTEVLKTRGFSLASLIVVDSGSLLSLTYDCEVTYFRPTGSELGELAAFYPFEYQRCLTSPVVTGNLLFVRNEKQIAAYKVDPSG